MAQRSRSRTDMAHWDAEPEVIELPEVIDIDSPEVIELPFPDTLFDLHEEVIDVDLPASPRRIAARSLILQPPEPQIDHREIIWARLIWDSWIAEPEDSPGSVLILLSRVHRRMILASRSYQVGRLFVPAIREFLDETDCLALWQRAPSGTNKIFASAG